jgi:hypothetical protein
MKQALATLLDLSKSASLPKSHFAYLIVLHLMAIKFKVVNDSDYFVFSHKEQRNLLGKGQILRQKLKHYFECMHANDGYSLPLLQTNNRTVALDSGAANNYVLFLLLRNIFYDIQFVYVSSEFVN